MTTVTLTREAAMQVLDALNESVDAVRNEYSDYAAMYKGYPSRLARVNGMKALLDAHESAIAIMKAALDAPAQPAPMFWVRLCGDGLYEGPIHNARIEKVRRQSGVWSPLYLRPPAPQALAQETPEQHLQHIAEFGELQNMAPARDLSDADIFTWAQQYASSEDSSSFTFTKYESLYSIYKFARAVLAASKAKTEPLEPLAGGWGCES